MLEKVTQKSYSTFATFNISDLESGIISYN